ncbi:MAG: hypothetical protein K2G24_00555 [Muribaculaceae bacterium]|nr:hypothetical protein [Muribaculaceae bacterium]
MMQDRINPRKKKASERIRENLNSKKKDLADYAEEKRDDFIVWLFSTVTGWLFIISLIAFVLVWIFVGLGVACIVPVLWLIYFIIQLIK